MAQIKTKFIENSAITNAKVATGIDAVKLADGSVTNTEFQYIGGLTSDAQTQITARALDSVVIKKDGSVAFTADQSMGGFKLTNLATPTSSTDAATKAYVDATASGLDVKASVRAISTTNITLSGAQTIDGVSIIAGDRVLVAGQTTGSENGIYDAASGAWARSSDANVSAEVTAGMFTFIEEGTTYADSGWVLTTNNPITLDTTSLAFSQFSGAGAIEAGAGLTKTGNTINAIAGDASILVNADEFHVQHDAAGATSTSGTGIKVNVAASGGIEISSNSLQIKSDTTTANTLAVTLTSNGAGTKYDANSFTESSEALALAAGVAGAGLALTTGVLSVNVDDSTIEINTDTLRVKDAGITLAKMASDSVDENKIVSTTISTTGALNGGSGTKLSTRVDTTTVKINGSNNLESLKPTEQHPTLSATDITNQYYDLSFAAYGTSASVNSISLSVDGGLEQLKGTDYTVSLTGGAGGVTRITFAGDLATGGAAELVENDILMIKYSYLT